MKAFLAAKRSRKSARGRAAVVENLGTDPEDQPFRPRVPGLTGTSAGLWPALWRASPGW